ncbi:RNA-binding S4 domain-containing protein [Plastorhodobacter daqingensis]|uniref:RNA-binding S4 domain-containing protein n=1 Tax=Plastorhodobacter daqingensis TaxID=1387281 RepID=A0ABW2UFA1_9RHOB
MAGPGGPAAARASIRLDKWLWFARFFKTRGLACRFIEAGTVRINRMPVAKTSVRVAEGDVLTFALGPRVHVVQVVALGTRRGPASEAQTLYLDLTAVPAADVPPLAARDE